MNKLYSGLRSNPANQLDNYSNYKSIVYTFSGNVIDEINKKDSLYKVPTAKENLIYTGLELALINAGSTSTGTIKYSSDNINWNTTIPCGTNAGTYILYWKVVGDIDHNDIESTTITASIAKATPTYTAPTGKENLEYTGEAQSLLNVGSTSDGTIKYSLDGTNWSTSIPTGTDAQTYTCYWKLEGDANHNDVAQTTIDVEIASVTPSHDYVEIGGVKWATMNVGANSVTDTGLYFQWGDTQGYTSEQVGSGSGQKAFTWADYKFNPSGDGSTFTKYNETDGKTVLDTSDDAVTAAWGGNWRMPTTAEFQALGNAVNTVWTQVNGVYGLQCTDKTDSSKVLFFPAAGMCLNGSVYNVGSRGYYWPSSLYSSNVQKANNFGFFNNNVSWQSHDYDRYYGFAVRAVLDE